MRSEAICTAGRPAGADEAIDIACTANRGENEMRVWLNVHES